jgi:hypothetical protein
VSEKLLIVECLDRGLSAVEVNIVKFNYQCGVNKYIFECGVILSLVGVKPIRPEENLDSTSAQNCGI